MKNAYKFIGSLVLVTLAFFAMQNSSNAQCSLVLVDANGNVANKLTVSCDFPVFVNTGDASADNAAWLNEKTAWMSANSSAYNQWAPTSYFEIHMAELSSLPAARQAAIYANLGLYHVIQ